MTESASDELVPLAEAKIVHIEMLDTSFLVVTFSNGDAVKLDIASVKELALTSPVEHIRSESNAPLKYPLP